MINTLFFRFSLLFFFLMLVVPTTFQSVRGVMLSVLVAGAVYSASVGKWKINKGVLFIGVGCITASLLFMNYGLLNNAPGAVAVGTVYVLWPLLFMFFMGVLNNSADFQPFIKTIILGVACSSAMGVLLVASSLGLIELNLEAAFEFQGASVGIYDSTFEYQLYNLTTIMYGFGFLLALLVFPENRNSLNKFWYSLVQVTLLLACIAMFLSGRRAFWIVAAISPLVIYSLSMLAGLGNPFKFKKSIYLIAFLLLISLMAIVMFGINFGGIFDNVILGFEFNDSSNESAVLRKEQFIALLSGWLESPFIGLGHGSFTPTSIRDTENQWAYELSYMALLFQVGILGLLVYASALAWLYVKSIRIIRIRPETASLLLPPLVGLTGFLVANATNPYLAKFDYLWTIFLPVAILNSYLLQKPK